MSTVQCRKCNQVKPVMPGTPLGADAVPVAHVTPAKFTSATTRTPPEPCVGDLPADTLEFIRAERDRELEDNTLWLPVFDDDIARPSHPAIADPPEWSGILSGGHR